MKKFKVGLLSLSFLLVAFSSSASDCTSVSASALASNAPGGLSAYSFDFLWTQWGGQTAQDLNLDLQVFGLPPSLPDVAAYPTEADFYCFVTGSCSGQVDGSVSACPMNGAGAYAPPATGPTASAFASAVDFSSAETDHALVAVGLVALGLVCIGFGVTWRQMKGAKAA